MGTTTIEPTSESDAQIELFKKRSLARLTVKKVGQQNLGAHVSALICQAVACHQGGLFHV